MSPLNKDQIVTFVVNAKQVQWRESVQLCCIDTCNTDSIEEIIRRMCITICQLRKELDELKENL